LSRAAINAHLGEGGQWAIADSSGSGYFCVGDINRQFSQAKRGGGAVHHPSPEIVLLFNLLVFCPLHSLLLEF
jgi:hypothetical protein